VSIENRFEAAFFERVNAGVLHEITCGALLGIGWGTLLREKTGWQDACEHWHAKRHSFA
jgi:hypothetical protein